MPPPGAVFTAWRYRGCPRRGFRETACRQRDRGGGGGTERRAGCDPRRREAVRQIERGRGDRARDETHLDRRGEPDGLQSLMRHTSRRVGTAADAENHIAMPRI